MVYIFDEVECWFGSCLFLWVKKENIDRRVLRERGKGLVGLFVNWVLE